MDCSFFTALVSSVSYFVPSQEASNDGAFLDSPAESDKGSLVPMVNATMVLAKGTNLFASSLLVFSPFTSDLVVSVGQPDVDRGSGQRNSCLLLSELVCSSAFWHLTPVLRRVLMIWWYRYVPQIESSGSGISLPSAMSL